MSRFNLKSVCLHELDRPQFAISRLVHAMLRQLAVEVSDPLAHVSLDRMLFDFGVSVKRDLAEDFAVLLLLSDCVVSVESSELAYGRCLLRSRVIRAAEVES